MVFSIGGGHKERMAKRGIPDPRDEKLTPGGLREGFKSSMAEDDISKGCEEVTCEACGNVYPAFQTRCNICKEPRSASTT